MLQNLVTNFSVNRIPRASTTSSAARVRTTHLVCGSCKRKLEHVQTCLNTRVCLTQQPSDTLRPFRELNCRTGNIPNSHAGKLHDKENRSALGTTDNLNWFFADVMSIWQPYIRQWSHRCKNKVSRSWFRAVAQGTTDWRLPCHGTYCHILPCHGTYCHILPCHGTYCHILPCHGTYCHILQLVPVVVHAVFRTPDDGRKVLPKHVAEYYSEI
jgi:hypothetical protein